jgi:Flp pilus assembly protein TadG
MVRPNLSSFIAVSAMIEIGWLLSSGNAVTKTLDTNSRLANNSLINDNIVNDKAEFFLK